MTGEPYWKVHYNASDRWHGTIGGYSNHRCRCSLCTKVHRENHLRYMHAHPEQQHKNRQRMIIRDNNGEAALDATCEHCGLRLVSRGMGFHLSRIHGILPILPEHGTTARYQHGCRCSWCKGAAAKYKRERRRRGLAN